MNNKFFDRFVNWGPGKKMEQPGKAAELEDKVGDPLHDWHQDGKQETNSLAENEDGLILSEEESQALERDNKDWIEAENITEEGHFSEYISSDNNWKEEAFSNVIDNLETEIPFEEQDILGDALRSRVAQKESKVSNSSRLKHQELINKKSIEDLPLYSLEDFKLMKDAVLFNDLAQYRPKFADGSMMTDEQIIEKVATFLAIQEGRGPKSVSSEEMRLMGQCKDWYDVASQKADYKEMPRRADGKLFSQQEIDELVYEYHDLRKNEPLEFAKLKLQLIGDSKVEKGEWKKTAFRFDEKTYKGEKQWVCNKDETHDGKVVHVRYVSFVDPSLVAKPGTVGTFYYTVKNERINPKDSSLKMSFIDLKVPFVKEQNNKPVKEEVSKQEKMAA